MVLALQFELAT